MKNALGGVIKWLKTRKNEEVIVILRKRRLL